MQFPVVEKITVAPEHRHPLYRELIAEQPSARSKPDESFRAKLESHGITVANADDIMWNFEKFLVDRGGNAVARFAPDVAPDDSLITSAIEQLL